MKRKLTPILAALAVTLLALASTAMAVETFSYDAKGNLTHIKGIPVEPIPTVEQARAATEKRIAEIKAEEAKQAAQAATSGQIVNRQSDIVNSDSLFYTGKPLVGDVYQFKYRQYSPELGRWLSFDPSGYPDGPNNVIYVNNYVLTALDIFGLDIHHINNSSAVNGAGHSAAIVGNGSTGYDYYSFGPDGKGAPVGAGSLTHKHFRNLEDALDFARAEGYNREQHWVTDLAADDAARSATQEWNDKTYHVTTSNCWNMVADMLDASGVTFVDRGQVPNINFNANKYLADGSSLIE